MVDWNLPRKIRFTSQMQMTPFMQSSQAPRGLRVLMANLVSMGLEIRLVLAIYPDNAPRGGSRCGNVATAPQWET